MTILRNPNRDRFTTTDNAPLEDPSLSFEAIGVFMYLLSKPDGWKIIPAEVAKRGDIGRDKLRRIFRELKAAGYLRDRRPRDSTGVVKGQELVLVEAGTPSPLLADSDLFDRTPEKPSSGDRAPEKPESGSPGIREIRPLVNTETESKDSIAAPDGTAQERGARKRDPVFEALCEIQGSNTAELTRSMAGAIGTAKKQIAEAWEAGGHVAEELPAEIHRRARALQKRYPEIHVTATALAKHWSTLGEPPKRSNGAGESPEDRDRREFQEAVSDARGTLRLLGDPEHLQPPDDASRRDMLAWIERVNAAWDEHAARRATG